MERSGTLGYPNRWHHSEGANEINRTIHALQAALSEGFSGLCGSAEDNACLNMNRELPISEQQQLQKRGQFMFL
jgi:hypothetical protein